MSESEEDVQVLLKKGNKYFILKVKPGIAPDWARKMRVSISRLFNDYHTLEEIKIKEFKKLYDTEK